MTKALPSTSVLHLLHHPFLYINTSVNQIIAQGDTSLHYVGPKNCISVRDTYPGAVTTQQGT